MHAVVEMTSLLSRAILLAGMFRLVFFSVFLYFDLLTKGWLGADT